MLNLKLLPVVCIILLTICFSACKHETQAAHEEIAKDKTLSEAVALQKMAQAAFLYTMEKHKPFQATKNSAGKYTLVGYVHQTSSITSLSQKNLGRVNQLLDAKYLWRIFRGGVSRNLSAIVFSRKMTLSGGQVIELYRVRLTLAQLKKIPGWESEDPFSVGEHDVLDAPAARKVVEKIVAGWTVELDNTAKVRVN